MQITDCQHFIEILSTFYQDLVNILLKFRRHSIEISSTFYRDFVDILSRSHFIKYLNLVILYHSISVVFRHFAMILWWHDAWIMFSFVIIFCWRCDSTYVLKKSILKLISDSFNRLNASFFINDDFHNSLY